VQSAYWLNAYGRTTCCRSPRRCRAARHSCLQYISCASLVVVSPLTFDPHVGERRAIRNELGFDALSFERVPTLCIWMRRAWMRDYATNHGGRKSSLDEPHCKTNAQFLRSEERRHDKPQRAERWLQPLHPYTKGSPGTMFRVAGTVPTSACTLYAILLPWVSSWIDKVLAIYCNLSEIYPGKSEWYRTHRG
jgi:hypothetical protein